MSQKIENILNLALEGSSSISSRAITEGAEVYGIAVVGDLTISGAGSLEIAGASGPAETYNYGIMTTGKFTLQSGSVTVVLGTCGVNVGIYSASLLVEGGVFTIEPAAAPQTTGACIGIMSETEADFKAGKLSVTTPIAKALMGRKLGDKVEVQVPAGKVEFEIMDISI